MDQFLVIGLKRREKRGDYAVLLRISLEALLSDAFDVLFGGIIGRSVSKRA